MKIKQHFRLAADLQLYCEYRELFYSTSRHLYSINIRLVYAVHAVGKGSASGKMCGIMNLPKLGGTKMKLVPVWQIQHERYCNRKQISL